MLVTDCGGKFLYTYDPVIISSQILLLWFLFLFFLDAHPPKEHKVIATCIFKLVWNTNLFTCTHKNGTFVKGSMEGTIYNPLRPGKGFCHCMFPYNIGLVYIHGKLILMICYCLNHMLICFWFVFSVFSLTGGWKILHHTSSGTYHVAHFVN